MYIMFKWITWLDEQKKNGSAFARAKNHVNCYFSCVIDTGFSAKNNHKMTYRNLNSAMWPVPHDGSLPVPESPEHGLVFLEKTECLPDATQHSSDELVFPREEGFRKKTI
jgi:hypothetical protein